MLKASNVNFWLAIVNILNARVETNLALANPRPRTLNGTLNHEPMNHEPVVR